MSTASQCPEDRRPARRSAAPVRRPWRLRAAGLWLLVLLLGGASAAAGQEKRLGSTPAQWRAALPVLANVAEPDVFPGVDLIVGGHREQLATVFVVQPGGNPGAIALDFGAAGGVTFGADGEALVETPEGTVRMRALSAYQPLWDPGRGSVGRSGPSVAASFVQRAGGEVGLQVGSYDPARPLWIRFEVRYPGYEALMASKAAAVFVVTKTADTADGTCDADCSLREAVRAANATPGADVITVPAGTYTLTRTTGEDSFANAALHGDLDINDDVTINGAGAGSTIIQYSGTPPAGCDCKIFGINQDGTATDIQVTINGVTMQNARNTAPNSGSFQDTGGGMDIFLTGTTANVQITNSVVTNNAVANGSANAYGGGINIDSGFGTLGAFKGTVTLTNTDVTSNTADGIGGGVNLFGDNHNVTVTGGSVSSNQTLGTGGLGANGGGINIRHTNGGTVAIQGVLIDGNDAEGPGGGVAVAGSSNQTVNILNNGGTNTVISNNISRDGTGNEARGGGLFNQNSPQNTTLTNVVISGNTATEGFNNPRGGGIFNNGGTLVLNSVTITGNTSVEGGGLSNTNGSALTTFNGGLITNNDATDNGGGLHVLNGLVTLNGVTIQGNDADSDNNNDGDGGGIYRNSGTINVSGTTTIGGAGAGQGNTAFNGGGIFLTNGTISLTSGSDTVIGNQAKHDGGGLYLGTGGTFNLTSVTIQGNAADSDTNNDGDGGGIFRGGGTLNFGGTTTIGGTGAGQPNTAFNGGGIANTSGSFTLNGASDAITGNQADNDGGGLYVTSGTITLNGTNLLNNAADSDGNGTGRGGGIFNNGGTVTIDNTALIGGAGTGNSADDGGGIANVGGTLNLNGTSVLGNQANDDGGGLFVTGGTANLSSVLLQSNSADGDGNGDGNGGGLYYTAGAAVNVTTTITVGGTGAGQGNTAFNGGGLFNGGSTLTIPSAAITNNEAVNDGGGLFVNGGTVNLDDATVQGNRADSDASNAGSGGGLHILSGTVNLGATTPVTIGGAGAGQGNQAATGGGIANLGSGTVTMTGGSVAGNQANASNGGGVFSGGTALTLDGVAVTGNQAVINGGGLAATAGTVNINNGGTFFGNAADSDGNSTGDGGAIHNNGATINLPNGTVIGGTGAGQPNTAQRGGGLAQATNGSITMTGGEIEGNTADGDGGGVIVLGGTLTLNDLNTSIRDNTAGDDGGGLAGLGGTITLSENNIVSNDATDLGGGLYIDGSALTMNFTRIFGNTAGTAATTGLSFVSGTLTDITNNWWGCNDDPDGGAGCDQVSGAGGAQNPRLVLTHTPNPGTAMPGDNVTLTADFLQNSAGAPIAASNLDALIGLPITFDNAMNGAISSPEPTIQSDGTADATFTVGPSLGTASADATVDNGTDTAVINVVGDFGDAPDPTYPTLLASDGARHAGAGGPRLGALVDGETDGQPDATATGDDTDGTDDEDGVTFTTPLIAGETATVDVDVQSAPGVLSVWIDFNGDGDWDDAGEQVYDDQAVAVGNNSLPVAVPASATPGGTFARFRVCSAAATCDTTTGQAPDGEVEDYAAEIASLDFGDAPDATGGPATGNPYPTLREHDGARHVIDGVLFLGAAVDADADGQPSADAGEDGTTGDDGDGTDDEDGVAFTSLLVPGETVTLDVTASASGLLNAWLDLNGDGDWADAGEQIFTDEALAAGVNSLSFTLPATATPGLTFARFRADTGGGLSYDGLANDGEVEDYQAAIESLDFGDAPDPTYPTLLASDGARHVIDGVLFLGSTIDADADGQPSADAGDDGTTGDDGDGTDDEDGVVFTSPLQPGLTVSVEVTASASSLLNAWIDYNADGDWGDAGEQIFTDEPLAAGVNSLSFTVPGGATIGDTFARFRADTGGGLAVTGLANDGEVEDYQVTIMDAPDLAATKADQILADDGDGEADPGETIRYTIAITNSGGDALNTVFTDTPGANTTLVVGSVTTSQGTVTTGNTAGDTSVTVDLGTVTSGGTPDATITFDVLVDDPFPAGIPEVINQGEVTASNAPGPVATDDPGTGAPDDPTVTPVDNPAKVVINEIDYDQPTPPASDEAEFIELKNVGTVPVDLADLDLVLVNGDAGGAVIYDTITLPSTTLAVGEYFVICGNAANVENCDLDVTPDVNLIQNGAPDAVALVAPAGTTTYVHDTVSYEGTPGDPYTEPSGGAGAPADPAAPGPNSPDDDKGISRVDLGGADPNDKPDTDNNAADFAVACITPGEANTTKTSNCARPVFDVTKTDEVLDADLEANPGDTLKYTVEIENNGGTGLNTVFTDTLETNLTLVVGSVMTSQGTVTSGNTPGDTAVGVALGDLDNTGGTPVVIMFEASINRPFPAFVDSVRNQGFVDADNLDTGRVPSDDPDTGAAGDSTATEVVAVPDLRATKTDEVLDADLEANPGDTLKYTVAVTNFGDQDAAGVVFSDTLAANLQLVPGSVMTTQGTIAEGPNDFTVDLGTVAGDTASVTIMFEAEIAFPLPAGVDSVYNQGRVTAANQGDVLTDDPDTGAAGDSTATEVVAAPDLVASKTDGRTTAIPGETLTYTISYENDGDQDATGVTLKETVPVGTTSGTNPGWEVGSAGSGTACDAQPAGTMCFFTVGALAAGDSLTVDFVVDLDNPAGAGVEVITNTASISDDAANGPDPNPGDNTTTDTTTLDASAQVSATKVDVLLVDTDGDGKADPDDTIRYTIVITNDGDQDVADVVLTDLPGTGTTLVVGSVTTTQGTIVSGNTAGDTSVEVDLTTIDGEPNPFAPLASATVTFDVTVDNPFPASSAFVENQGTVAFTGEGGPEDTVTDDPDTPEPLDPTRTPVDRAADLELTKTASSPTPDFGGEVVFTLTLTNDGPTTPAGATVEDVLPEGLAFVSATATSGAYDAENGVWENIAVAAGASETLMITARVETTAPVTNTAEVVKATLPDPDSTPGDGAGDDYAEVTITPVAADLSLEKDVEVFTELPRVPGQPQRLEVTFLVAVTNLG
ncbi:MAG: GEVED domain-containing protein, partial [Rhodothermales bacterium]|nr:GEVED domain-containing protein [Rhodothermales bacterium]